MLVDPGLDIAKPGYVPVTWATRASFCHPLSADRWVKSLEDASSAESDLAVLRMYESIIAGVDTKIGVYLSLGAGDGLVDTVLLPYLSRGALTYVSVDLSQDMCRLAVDRMKLFSATSLGVVTDFERESDFLRDILHGLEGHAKFINGTSILGNLDLAEVNFFENLHAVMKRGDWMLLSVGTGSFGQPIDRSMLDARLDWKNLRGMLSCGICMHTGEDVQSVEHDLENRLNVRKGRSDVPDTESVELWDIRSGAALMHFRRYSVDALVQWVERLFKFEVVASAQLPFSDAGLGVAGILLRVC
ncbi:MAG TPA: L-histidine N(alpha)-methyltransferase [Pyrinomonadaceae bacterium]|nr:L-histidine N(alpha)-methyltransferase [Pyrinomonadaceae bacterium]